ncbi:hypothetical protein HPP92_005452 [Vanilla planifolia]|uniref:HhH-GPD domain-containing protein n=1 Tax=Vanilla planifolia TaxID=51239 RepID=A0A835RPQ6_VANPL|nr:hypothetical protein HPP92_005452 [Vanilla planifolia]
MLAEIIKDFLNRLVREHGNIDLEWLRDVPPDKSKDFLLSIRGLGLKSAECVRLLTLHHLAFPVDTNVGRICVRLGWVPLNHYLNLFNCTFWNLQDSLPAPEDKSIVTSTFPSAYANSSVLDFSPQPIAQLECSSVSKDSAGPKLCEPIVEEPATPEPECQETLESAIEEAFFKTLMKFQQ